MKAEPRIRRGMEVIMNRIGVQSCAWYSDNDPDGSFRYIKECGFNAVDFNIDHKLPGAKIMSAELTTFFDKSLEELFEFYRPLKAASEKYDVEISQMHAPFPVFRLRRDGLDDKVNDYVIMALEKCCAVCDFLNCRALVVHPHGRSTKEKETDSNLTLYRKLIPFAKKYNVKICLENMFGVVKGRPIEWVCSRAEEAVRYIDTLNEEAGGDYFGFCLDVGHATLTGKNLREYINILGPRLTCLHIHDNDGRTDLHVMPYTQLVDWESFILGLRDIGYKGTIGFETFRVLTACFPKELWPSALKLISDTGKYFATRIAEEA